MAPKGSMQGFVRNKNPQQDARNTGSPTANPDLNDLKTAVPKSTTKAQKKQKTKQSDSGQDQSGRQSQFRDDASSRSNDSSADAISTTASTSRLRNGGHQQIEFNQPSHNRNADRLSAAFGGTDFTESLNDGFEGGPQLETALNYDEQMNSKYQNMVQDSRSGQPGPTIAQTPIKGDSYPATSTGAPSLADQREHDAAHASKHRSYGPKQAVERGAFPDRARKPQIQTLGAQRQHMPDRNEHQELPALSRQPYAPITFDPEPADSGGVTGGGFTYGLANPQVALASSRHQRPNVGQHLNAAANKVDGPNSHKHVPQRGLHAAEVQTLPFARPGPRPGQLQHAGAAYNQMHEVTQQAQIADQAPLSDAYTEDEPGDHTERQGFHDNGLDYDQSELFEKDLESLQAEPFDHSVSAQSFFLPDMPGSASLADKVAHIEKTEQKTQSAFFAGLNIDDWEEAGDWFLDRFGETIKKLKDVRRAKRKAALAFEEEIEKREFAVDKKHALTEEGLADMKTNGLAVLQGTPKKYE